jgi:hypothetical protein
MAFGSPSRSLPASRIARLTAGKKAALARRVDTRVWQQTVSGEIARAA